MIRAAQTIIGGCQAKQCRFNSVGKTRTIFSGVVSLLRMPDKFQLRRAFVSLSLLCFTPLTFPFIPSHFNPHPPPVPELITITLVKPP
jgi:hypothetical protein